MSSEWLTTKLEFLWDELKRPRFWILLVGGVISLLVSMVLDADSKDHWYNDHHVYLSVLHEFGFALLIAFLLVVFVESSSKAELHWTVQKHMLNVSRNALEAAYGTTTSPVIVRHALCNILAVPVTRTTMKATFILENIPADSICSEKFILLTVQLEYEISNLSGGATSWPVRVRIPKAGESSQDDLARILFCAIGNEIQEAPRAEDKRWYYLYTWECKLFEGERKQIFIDYQVAKKRSDIETWMNLLTTENMRIVVENRIDDICWDFLSHTSAEVTPINAIKEGPWKKGRTSFNIADPMLPYHGWILTWRPISMAEGMQAAVVE